jgi:hypothetical protein
MQYPPNSTILESDFLGKGQHGAMAIFNINAQITFPYSFSYSREPITQPVYVSPENHWFCGPYYTGVRRGQLYGEHSNVLH